MVNTLGELYLEAKKSLMAREDPQTAGFYARNLLCHVSGLRPEQLLADSHEPVRHDVQQAMWQAVDRILADEPLAYVLGQWEFYGLQLQVSPDVLIPRDDTCAVVDLAMSQALFLPKRPRILDLCTGSGCIGLALASKIPDARVTLADLSPEALTMAKKNVAQLKLSGRVSCCQADALAEPQGFLGQFDMIISNPPYITTEEMIQLPTSVKEFEPHMALHGGDDGLIFYRSITQNYRKALKPGGFLCYEFGMGQGDAVCEILRENGFTILERTKDFNNRERAVLARYDRKDDYDGDKENSL